MKKIGYWIFGILFHFFRIFPVKNKKVVLFMVHDCKFQGNIRYVYEEMKRRQEGFQFVILSKRNILTPTGTGIKKVVSKIKGTLQFFVGISYHFATAEYVFLNDNFLPLAYMNPSKKTKIVQLWHGVGAFKRFGLTTEGDELVRKCVKKGNQKVTHLFVSSSKVIPCYEDALAIKKERIFPTGIPLTDFYFDEAAKKKAGNAVYENYPELKGKKILLYAPTFRETSQQNKDIFKYFSMEKVMEQLGEDWCILVRLHPHVREAMPKLPKGCYDMTEYSDIKGLFVVSDLLVADYSSVVVEYVLLGKPILLYAYDLEQYDRGFYGPYEEEAPGMLLRSEEEFLEALTKPFKMVHFDKFIEKQYDGILDGQSTKRVVDRVVG